MRTDDDGRRAGRQTLVRLAVPPGRTRNLPGSVALCSVGQLNVSRPIQLARSMAMAISRVSGIRAAAAGMLAVALAPSSLAAQDVGDRVRVFVGGTTTIGAVSAVSDEGFELLGDGRRQSFAYGTIYRLEQSLGTRSLWKKGLAYGAGAGFGAGVLLGFLHGSACDALTLGTFRGECAEGSSGKPGQM